MPPPADQSSGQTSGSAPTLQQFASTLQRAIVYSEEQAHRLVTAEHLLLALTEDPDAIAVIQRKGIDIDQLRNEIASIVSRNEDRFPYDDAGQPMYGSDLLRILNTANSGASARRPVDGALVLAAIIADGRTPAAELIRLYGLTFDEASRYVRPPANTPPVAHPSLATVRISAREAALGYRKRGELPPGAVPAGGRDARATGAPLQAPLQPAESLDEPVQLPLRQNETPANLRSVGNTRRMAAGVTGQVASPPQQMPGQAPPVQAASSMPPPVWPAPQTPAVFPQGWPDSPPRAPLAGRQNGFPQQTYGTHGGEPSWPDPNSAAQQQPVAAQDWDQTQYRDPAAAPPYYDGGQQSNAYAPQLYEADPYPQPPMPVSQHQRQVPQPAPAAPAHTQGQAGKPRGRKAAPRARRLTERDMFELSVPRLMRIGEPVRVEARIASHEVELALFGLNLEIAPQPAPIAHAMAVRLRASDDSLLIEAVSPETHWLDGVSSIIDEDFASWRWNVTPLKTGTKSLQLTASTRGVAAEGLLGEQALPSQTTEVRVRGNGPRWLGRNIWWIVITIAAGLVGAFGGIPLQVIMRLLSR